MNWNISMHKSAALAPDWWKKWPTHIRETLPYVFKHWTPHKTTLGGIIPNPGRYNPTDEPFSLGGLTYGHIRFQNGGNYTGNTCVMFMTAHNYGYTVRIDIILQGKGQDITMTGQKLMVLRQHCQLGEQPLQIGQQDFGAESKVLDVFKAIKTIITADNPPPCGGNDNDDDDDDKPKDNGPQKWTYWDDGDDGGLKAPQKQEEMQQGRQLALAGSNWFKIAKQGNTSEPWVKAITSFLVRSISSSRQFQGHFGMNQFRSQLGQNFANSPLARGVLEYTIDYDSIGNRLPKMPYGLSVTASHSFGRYNIDDPKDNAAYFPVIKLKVATHTWPLKPTMLKALHDQTLESVSHEVEHYNEFKGDYKAWNEDRKKYYHFDREVQKQLDEQQGTAKFIDYTDSLRKYYLQPAEIRAFVTGFYLRAKQQRKPLTEIMEQRLRPIYNNLVENTYHPDVAKLVTDQIRNAWLAYAKTRYPDAIMTPQMHPKEHGEWVKERVNFHTQNLPQPQKTAQNETPLDAPEQDEKPPLPQSVDEFDNIDPHQYVPRKDINAEFWGNPPEVLFHGTNRQNIGDIMKTGLKMLCVKRGPLDKRECAIFTSPRMDIPDILGSSTVKIFPRKMKAAGYMPRVTREEQIDKQDAYEELAKQMGQPYKRYLQPQQGYEPDTVVFYGAIPPKFLGFAPMDANGSEILDLNGEWIKTNPDGTITMWQSEEPGVFSNKPRPNARPFKVKPNKLTLYDADRDGEVWMMRA